MGRIRCLCSGFFEQWIAVAGSEGRVSGTSGALPGARGRRWTTLVLTSAGIRTGLTTIAFSAFVGECACTPERPDGFVDLTLKFSCKEIAGAVGDVEDGDVLPLTITGSLTDGTAFETSDCVLILSKGQDMPSVAPEDAAAQSEFKLGPIAPNPFKGVTRITYWLPGNESVKLSIYDAAGRLVRILANEVQGPGEHVVEWDAGHMPSGVYFCRLEIGHDVKVKRIRLVK